MEAPLFTLLASMVLAISTPPAQVLACVLFIVAAILSGIQKSWVLCLIAAGLAVAHWPWGFHPRGHGSEPSPAAPLGP